MLLKCQKKKKKSDFVSFPVCRLGDPGTTSVTSYRRMSRLRTFIAIGQSLQERKNLDRGSWQGYSNYQINYVMIKDNRSSVIVVETIIVKRPLERKDFFLCNEVHLPLVPILFYTCLSSPEILLIDIYDSRCW